MSTPSVPSPAVVMFDQTTGQNFSGSSFAAAGRDHINLNIHVATAGVGLPSAASPLARQSEQHCPPNSLPAVSPEAPQLPQPSLISRVYQRLRTRHRRRPRSILLPAQTTESVHRPLDTPHQPSPAPPPSSPASDLILLPDGSSISSFDSSEQLSLSRSHVSTDEEVYERSLLTKGKGYPLFEPQPFGEAAKYGDFGILSEDGFQSFGNLYDLHDQRKFSLESPQMHTVVCQPEKLPEGQVLSTGIEEVARSAGSGGHATNSFTFHCRQPQGAVLVVPSAGELETLAPKSRNDLRDYLCEHGTRLMTYLRRERYLETGQSLYVVTGTIKSSSWGIAVHTSPMEAPYDQLVLSKRPGERGPTHEWTTRGGAYARCGSSAAVDDSGQRVKDQSLFLRGFLLTPSSKPGRKDTTDDDFSAGDSSSGTRDSDHDGPDKADKRRDSSSRRHQGGLDPNKDQIQSQGRHSQLRDTLGDLLVEQFPAPATGSKRYYPSQRVNDALLAKNDHIDLAITHDDDWRHSIVEGYLDDEALDLLMESFWSMNASSVSSRAVTARPSTLPLRLNEDDVLTIVHPSSLSTTEQLDTFTPDLSSKSTTSPLRPHTEPFGVWQRFCPADYERRLERQWGMTESSHRRGRKALYNQQPRLDVPLFIDMESARFQLGGFNDASQQLDNYNTGIVPPQARAQKGEHNTEANGAVRANAGCWTCRIRRKKCGEEPTGKDPCQTCDRLRLECLGFGTKRPEWLMDKRNTSVLRDKIKVFLSSQGHLEGHSISSSLGTGRGSAILKLSSDPSSSDQGSGSENSNFPVFSVDDPRHRPPIDSALEKPEVEPGWLKPHSPEASKSEPLEMNDASDLVKRMMQGLEYLHSLDIPSRDIKPANILVRNHVHCTITDFGQSYTIPSSGGRLLVDTRCGHPPNMETLDMIEPYLDMWRQTRPEKKDVPQLCSSDSRRLSGRELNAKITIAAEAWRSKSLRRSLASGGHYVPDWCLHDLEPQLDGLPLLTTPLESHPFPHARHSGSTFSACPCNCSPSGAPFLALQLQDLSGEWTLSTMSGMSAVPLWDVRGLHLPPNADVSVVPPGTHLVLDPVKVFESSLKYHKSSLMSVHMVNPTRYTRPQTSAQFEDSTELNACVELLRCEIES